MTSTLQEESTQAAIDRLLAHSAKLREESLKILADMDALLTYLNRASEVAENRLAKNRQFLELLDTDRLSAGLAT